MFANLNRDLLVDIQSEIRRVFLDFEFEKDAQRRDTFLSQAEQHCDFRLIDMSLPAAVHDTRWQLEAQRRIQSSAIIYLTKV